MSIEEQKINCLNCKSQFLRDRICISDECPQEEYLKYICKMCHYQQHKLQGRLKVTELDLDIFKKDIEELLQVDSQEGRIDAHETLYTKSEQTRQKIQKQIEFLQKCDQQLEQYQTEFCSFKERFHSAFKNLSSKDESELQQSVYKIFEEAQICPSDDSNQSKGYWRFKGPVNKDKENLVLQICEIIEYLNSFTNLENIDSILKEISKYSCAQESLSKLDKEVIEFKEKLVQLEITEIKEQTLNECNRLAQLITKYFTNWFNFDYIQMVRQTCSSCNSFYYVIWNSYYNKLNQQDQINNSKCNSCGPQYRSSSDPKGTSTFYYYAHEQSSDWIKTRNGQDLYNFYTKNLEKIQQYQEQLLVKTTEVEQKN